MLISLIVVADEKNAIGYQNQLLCHLPADLKYFRAITTGHHIVMGRKTFESIGKPLPNRTNIVISSNPDLTLEGCIVVNSL
jgi:dihydrofolate reductase